MYYYCITFILSNPCFVLLYLQLAAKLATAAGPRASLGEDSDYGTTDVVGSPCKQHHVFFLVRRAVLLRCPDLLLLFLCRRRPRPPLVLLFHSSCPVCVIKLQETQQQQQQSYHLPLRMSLMTCSNSSQASGRLSTSSSTPSSCTATSGGISDPSVTLASLVDASDTFLFCPVRRECQSKHSSTWRSERRR